MTKTIVTVVPQRLSQLHHSHGTSVTTCYGTIDNMHGTVVTIGILTSITCVLLAHYYRLTDKFAVSLSVCVLTDWLLVGWNGKMTDDR